MLQRASVTTHLCFHGPLLVVSRPAVLCKYYPSVADTVVPVLQSSGMMPVASCLRLVLAVAADGCRLAMAELVHVVLQVRSPGRCDLGGPQLEVEVEACDLLFIGTVARGKPHDQE